MTGTSLEERYTDASRAAGVGIWSNVGLAAGKLVVGLAAGSLSLIADALHSLTDALTSVVALVGLRIARRPPDVNHPYGHMRAETLAAAAIAGPLALSGLALAWTGIRGLAEPRPAPEIGAIWAAMASLFVKEGLFRYSVRVGRRTGSRAVIADAWHHRSDALSSAVVLVGLLLTRISPALWWVDPVAAIVVCGFIVWAAVNALRGAVADLMDERPGGDLEERLRALVAEHPRGVATEKVWIRRAGLEYSVDLHLEVAPDISVREGHDVAHEIGDRIRAAFPEIRNIQTHVEPAGRIGRGDSGPGGASESSPSPPPNP